jgi:hypothetical protein
MGFGGHEGFIIADFAPRNKFGARVIVASARPVFTANERRIGKKCFRAVTNFTQGNIYLGIGLRRINRNSSAAILLLVTPDSLPHDYLGSPTDNPVS